jgi:prolyl 4-hydroxylase
MAIELNDYIKVYDNVLDSITCRYLIDVFENNSDKHERVENNSKPNFTQFNLTENRKITEQVDNIHNYLIAKVYEYKRNYCQLFNDICFPQKHNFEQFRIKKYFPEKEDQFDTHVDVLDYSSSRRYLAFLWYLNDVAEGGETVFENLSITPKVGSMLVFPPLWLFVHKGNPPISNIKYIMSTYLHYI